jgi:hypothetical protein
MKFALLQSVVLTAAVALLVVAGQGPVAARWGAPGVAALHASAVICLGAALLAAIPLGLTATYWRAAAPQVAFAGVAIRLLVTGGVALAYQTLAQPNLTAFLTCIVPIYLVLLLVETLFIVFIVSRVLRQTRRPE